MLGMTPPNKQGIGIKSKLGSGYDLYILYEDMTHQYAQLHFCNRGRLRSLRDFFVREIYMTRMIVRSADRRL